MASTVSLFNADNFLQGLLCPVTYELLTNPVILTPCAHTISKVAHERLFQESNKRRVKEIRCPVCNMEVTDYFENYAIRFLAETILGVKPKIVLLAISDSIQADPEISLGHIPFPGKGAEFVPINKDWRAINMPGTVFQSLEFKSQTPGSLFRNMSVLRKENDGVSIFVKFNQYEPAIKYLLACGIDLDDSEKRLGFYTSNKATTKQLFTIIVKHNKIAPECFHFIRNLVESGKWS